MQHRLLLLIRPSLLWAIAFIIFLELILRLFPAVGMIFGSNMDFHRYYAEQRALSESDQIEILIVGDSSIQNSIVGREISRSLGLKDSSVFNLSYGGGSANTFLPFLNDNIDDFTDLKTIVWIYNDYRFAHQGCRYVEHLTMDFTQMINELGWYYVLTSGTFLKNISLLYRLIDLWRLENARFLFYLRYIQKKGANFFLPDSGGYMIAQSYSGFNGKASYYEPWLSDHLQASLDWYRDPKPCDLNIRAVAELTHILENAGIRFVALRHAVQQNARVYLDRVAPEQEYFADIGLTPIKKSKLGLVDKNTLLGFQPSQSSYYWDYQHLNFFGAIEYSRFVAKHVGGLILPKGNIRQ